MRACLNDTALARVVDKHLEQKKCDFCGRSSRKLVAAPVDAVTEHMAECISRAYSSPSEELPYDGEEGGYIGEVLDEWGLLEEVGFEVESEELFDEVRSAFGEREWCKKDYFALSPEDRQAAGWDRFKRAVKHERRFTFWSMRDDENEEYHPDYLPVGQMLAEIGDVIRASGVVKPLRKGTPFWRVRVHDTGKPWRYDHELSPPPRASATQSNRMSPAGVSMFYGSEDFDTAYAETVDPTRSKGKSVTGGCFRTVRQINVLDLLDLPPVPSFFDERQDDARHQLVFLRHFVNDLAQPISRDGREHVEYAPTQAFTEYVRYELKTQAGKPVEGIRYRSSRNGRACVVLFYEQDDCIANVEFRQREQALLFDLKSLRTKKIMGNKKK